MKNTDLSKQFARFAGREVDATERKQSHVFGGKTYESVSVSLSDTDPVIAEIRKAAGHLTLRVWTPDSIGTMDFRLDRLNIYVDKDPADGKYKVGNRFHLG
jgi:hypothetical protein